ncbi:MAG: hypothetical protein KAH30_06555 [Caldisericia bacterium]|nr:hypothetical protein [Caldisericia bacterium]
MNKKNMLMVSIIVVCVVILVSLGVSAFVSAGGNLGTSVSSGSCSGGEGCSPAEKANCASDTQSATGCSPAEKAGCGSSSAGCGSSATGVDYSQLEREAVEYYSSQTGETEITAKAYNGSNGIEVAIIKDKKVIEVLRYETK